MKQLIISISILGLMGCSGGGYKTIEDLSTKALQAIQSNDAVAYGKLFPLKMDFESLAKACGEDNPEARAAKMLLKMNKEIARIPKKLAKCAKLVPNWAGAKEIGRKGGTARKAKCGGRVTKYRDIEIVYDVGGTKIEVEIDNPAQVNGKFYLPDTLCDGKLRK